jgi:uncharacterized protein YggL (DUF469 family)
MSDLIERKRRKKFQMAQFQFLFFFPFSCFAHTQNSEVDAADGGEVYGIE